MATIMKAVEVAVRLVRADCQMHLAGLGQTAVPTCRTCPALCELAQPTDNLIHARIDPTQGILMCKIHQIPEWR